MYKVKFSNYVAKQLENIYKLDKKLYFRLISAIEALQVNPYQGKRLKGKFTGDYSLRVGDYRIVYAVYKNTFVVYIIDLGHRREIYR